MKKLLLEIFLGLSLPTAIFHTQIADVFTTEKPVTKQISLSIARDTNYNESAYDLSQASVHVVVFKVKDHKQIIVWDKVYDTLQLKQYPTLANALHQTITVTNIMDRKEKLYVTYTVTYNTNGSLLTLENGTSLLKGENKGDVMISL
jgi:hypothetical protein